MAGRGVGRAAAAKDAIATGRLTLADAHELAPLLAAHVQELKRGAPRRPDDFYAELLLQDRSAEVFGARLGGRLVGFALYFDQPDPVSGMRRCQLDDLFVIQDSRDQGVVRALVAGLLEEGKRRGWSGLRWMVPEKTPVRDHLAEKVGKSAKLRSYFIPIDAAGGALEAG